MRNKKLYYDFGGFIKDESPVFPGRKSLVEKLVENVIHEGGFEEGLRKTIDDGVKPIKDTVHTIDKIQHKVESVFYGEKEISKGDILAAKRVGGLYYHFAVYIGNDRVIHYAAKAGDYGEDPPCIHEASYEAFKRDSEYIYVMDFPENSHYRPKCVPATKSIIGRPVFFSYRFVIIPK